MARIFTTPATETAAKAWMHDVMVVAGVLPKNQRTVNVVRFTRYNRFPTAEAGKVCDELINRDFADIDSAINSLASYDFYSGFASDSKLKSLTLS